VRSTVWNVFARSNTGIVGLNPTRGRAVCVYSVFVLSCVGSGLTTGWSSVQIVLPIVCKIRHFLINCQWKQAREPKPSRERKKKNIGRNFLCYSASTSTVLPNTSCSHFEGTPWKTPSSIVQNSCLLVRYLAMDVLLLLSAYVAGMCLSARCLEKGIHVTIFNVEYIYTGSYNDRNK
jgi:hypothetical protein